MVVKTGNPGKSEATSVGLTPDLLVRWEEGSAGVKEREGHQDDWILFSRQKRLEDLDWNQPPLFIYHSSSPYFSYAPTIVLEYSAAVPFPSNFSLSDFSL